MTIRKNSLRQLQAALIETHMKTRVGVAELLRLSAPSFMHHLFFCAAAAAIQATFPVATNRHAEQGKSIHSGAICWPQQRPTPQSP